MNNIMLPLSSSIFLLILSACSTSPEMEGTKETSIGEIPSWVLSPTVTDGIAVSECVSFTGNFSIDKQHALTTARVSLAQSIDARVQAMDKTYRDKVENSEATQVGSTFSSVTKQLTNQTLNGSTLIRTDIVKIADKDNLCVLVAMGQENTREIFEQLVSKSKRSMNKEQKDLLYQEFKAEKANDMLEAEMAKAEL